MATRYDNDQITYRFRIRERGRWGKVQKEQATVAEARALRAECAGRNFSNTKPGEMVFLGVTGTLSQIHASGGK
jgi:hypothetical protein